MKMRSLLLVLAASLAAAARAAPPTPPTPVNQAFVTGVVSLSAAASVDVPKDLMTATLSTSRDGTDPNAVQAELKKALDAALAEARRAAKPGQLDVQTGNFSLVPRYSNKGVSTGWQGSAELIIVGRDMPAIGQLVGRIASMTVARVTYGLSREQREKVESDVAAQAIAAYQAKAADYAKRFGYAGYVVREVNVDTAEPAPPRLMAMKSGISSATVADELPIEAGKATVSVTVHGTVQMNR